MVRTSSLVRGRPAGRRPSLAWVAPKTAHLAQGRAREHWGKQRGSGLENWPRHKGCWETREWPPSPHLQLFPCVPCGSSGRRGRLAGWTSEPCPGRPEAEAHLQPRAGGLPGARAPPPGQECCRGPSSSRGGIVRLREGGLTGRDIWKAASEWRNKSSGPVLGERGGREGASQRGPRQPSASRLPKGGGAGKSPTRSSS
ncbi:mitotic-spindle organizing protein 2B isoform X3 [Monodelphis domestica]|uniref:mitotic-spindle organizing protein 2B isoform X3 n=1 Tax=Monodelphis domestica TaxID=13616 RepID=UPI0024E1E8F6|nr:mitotic-spindle organizing protein 2B isoform X3 [Monodelphis domestica]